MTWGRVQYEKGFQTFVHALPEVRQAVPGVRAVVAGQGSYLSDLHAAARAVGVEDICSFPGFVPDDELKGLLHEATVAVIPSLYEPFGIVALEAMAAGAPVLAAASGGLVEVIDGTGAGVLYPAGDAGALSAAMRRMLAQPDGLAEQQAAAAKLLEGYTWDAVAARTVPVYTAATARPTPPPERPRLPIRRRFAGRDPGHTHRIDIDSVAGSRGGWYRWARRRAARTCPGRLLRRAPTAPCAAVTATGGEAGIDPPAGSRRQRRALLPWSPIVHKVDRHDRNTEPPNLPPVPARSAGSPRARRAGRARRLR